VLSCIGHNLLIIALRYGGGGKAISMGLKLLKRTEDSCEKILGSLDSLIIPEIQKAKIIMSGSCPFLVVGERTLSTC